MFITSMVDQEKVLRYQILKQSLEEIGKREKDILLAIEEVENSKESLKEIKELKEEKDSFVNFGSGIFVKGKIYPVEKVLVDAGAGVVVEKSVEEAEEILEKRKENLEKALKKIEEDKSKILKDLEALGRELGKG